MHEKDFAAILQMSGRDFGMLESTRRQISQIGTCA
jgi:hypothetical protein